jgi:hypothetical protein
MLPVSWIRLTRDFRDGDPCVAIASPPRDDAMVSEKGRHKDVLLFVAPGREDEAEDREKPFVQLTRIAGGEKAARLAVGIVSRSEVKLGDESNNARGSN